MLRSLDASKFLNREISIFGFVYFSISVIMLLMLNTTSTETLNALIEGLEVGQARTLSRSPGFMPVHVDRLSEDLFSVAHYYEQNGDLVPDPDMVFVRTTTPSGETVWLPKELTLAIGSYVSAFELGEDGKPTQINKRRYRELVAFAHMWLRNIRSQQGLQTRKPPRGASGRVPVRAAG